MKSEPLKPVTKRCRCGKEDRMPGKLFGEKCMKAYARLWGASEAGKSA